MDFEAHIWVGPHLCTITDELIVFSLISLVEARTRKMSCWINGYHGLNIIVALSQAHFMSQEYYQAVCYFLRKLSLLCFLPSTVLENLPVGKRTTLQWETLVLFFSTQSVRVFFNKDRSGPLWTPTDSVSIQPLNGSTLHMVLTHLDKRTLMWENWTLVQLSTPSFLNI